MNDVCNIDELETPVFIGIVGRVPLGQVTAFKTGLAQLGLVIVYSKLSVDPLWIVRRVE